MKRTVPSGSATASGTTPAVSPGSFALTAPRNGFPGVHVTGTCLVVAPLLAVVATALGAGTYHARGVDFVAGMVAHQGRFTLAIQLSLVAMLFLLVAVIGLATLVTARRPAWGRVAGLVTIIGICGPISFESVYWAASKIIDTDAHRAVAARLIDQSQIIPGSVMNVSGPCLVVGFVLLGIAAAKADVLDRPRAVLLAATALVPFGFISGYLLFSAVGFACTAGALVPLGVRLLRGAGDRPGGRGATGPGESAVVGSRS